MGIFKIHLTRKKRDPVKFDLKRLSAVAEGFSGAEIEAAIIEGMYESFAQNRELTTPDIETAMRGTVPLLKTSAESIARLRAWAATRARAATSKKPAVSAAAAGGARG